MVRVLEREVKDAILMEKLVRREESDLGLSIATKR